MHKKVVNYMYICHHYPPTNLASGLSEFGAHRLGQLALGHGHQHAGRRLVLLVGLELAPALVRGLLEQRDARPEDDQQRHERRTDRSTALQREARQSVHRHQEDADPHEDLAEVVRVAAVAPQAAADELAVVALVVAELGLLVVRRDLDDIPDDPHRGADDVQRLHLRVVDAVRDTQQHGQQREEDPQTLDVPGRQEAQRVHNDVGEAFVAAALADAPVQERPEPHAPEPHERREQRVAPRHGLADLVGEHGDRRVGGGAREVEVPLGLVRDAVERRKPLEADASTRKELQVRHVAHGRHQRDAGEQLAQILREAHGRRKLGELGRGGTRARIGK
ncbi:unnamed protein product [Phytophthora lilii]|uniref:Unnamed protein product n=1 Tax=Phytophthora lilii TaxID=2077276 RepID=A0A9W6X848_9STRA|nr:unnamed protein product [Phytophthora lilii]